MKNSILIAVICCLSLACKKDAQNKSLTGGGPAIKSVSAFKAYSGSNQSVGFNVDLVADSASVEKVELFLSPSSLRWTVAHPKTGHYVMYDHVADYQQGAKYYFVFTTSSGDPITSDLYTLP